MRGRMPDRGRPGGGVDNPGRAPRQVKGRWRASPEPRLRPRRQQRTRRAGGGGGGGGGGWRGGERDRVVVSWRMDVRRGTVEEGG